MSSSTNPPMPYRQIRAKYDKDTITVYQAYSAAIAIPAVEKQDLTASPHFKPARMTWIKPSWSWMMYRSGYSYKDPNQAHILALKIPHHHFKHLLSMATVTTHSGKTLTMEQRARPIRVQWDPERSPSLQILPYRSIQIGVSGAMKENWAQDWIVGIEDVTERARALKRAIQEGGEHLAIEELVERGLVPKEEIYELEPELRDILGMGDD